MVTRTFLPLAAALLGVAVFSAGSLLVGASYATALLRGGLPVGNVLAALVFCGIAGAAALIAPRARPARPLALFALVGSIAWLPVSLALAGNLALNFSGQRGSVWLGLSLGLLVLDLAALVLAAAGSWLARYRSVKAGRP